MTKTIDTAAIESLCAFAESHGEIQFAHLCTEAMNGEEWAVERMVEARDRLSQFANTRNNEVNRVYVLRTTDTTRPDGLIARRMVSPRAPAQLAVRP